MGLIPGLGRSPGVGNGNPFQYFCLKNPMDKEAWCATVHGVTKSRTRLSTHTHTHTHISIISSMNCAFSVESKEPSSYPRLSKFSPIISSKHFIVLHFSFRYFIYLI